MNIDKQVKELLRRMTLEEKVGQMNQLQWKDPWKEKLPDDVRCGRIGSILGTMAGFVPLDKRNELQRIAVEETRLGIPLIFGYDVIHGYRTIFPIPLAQSCSWQPQVAEQAAAVAAAEAASDGVDWTFAPMVDIARDPRWGRIAEGYGEDPYLACAFAAAAVKGFQGKDVGDPARIVACLKHCAGYGAAEGGRDYNTAEITERTLREIYLRPFKAGVEAGAMTIMTAYNEIGGIPATANRTIFTDIIRGEWSFDGFVVSDWGAVSELVNHGVAADQAEAAEMALHTGVDMCMGCDAYRHLTRAVRRGKISKRQINRAVSRILRIKFLAGLFDNPYTDPRMQKTTMLAPENLAMARDAARKTCVLLKNEKGVLPLSENVKSVAVIGPLADSRVDLLGSWHAVGRAEDAVSLLTAMRQAVSPDCKLTYASGCAIEGGDTSGFAAAVEAARGAEAVILAVGESFTMSGEAHCRAQLGLPGVQQQLVEKIAALGKPTVAVLFAGRPLAISWIAKNIPAVLMAWQPGVQGGLGITDILFGDHSPSGKLTTSWPYEVGQVPIHYNHKNTARPAADQNEFSSKYLDCPAEPLYPFGFGLSYTTFAYANLKLSSAKMKTNGSVRVSIDVKNTGRRAGEEVVQLYVRDLVGSVARPVKELKGFEKAALRPGEKKAVSFVLKAADLAFWGFDNKFVVEPGKFKLWVGPDSTRGLEADFEVVATR